MSDITKCSGNGCHKKNKCWRFTSPASLYQLWIDPKSCIDDDFSIFWPIACHDQHFPNDPQHTSQS